ncbi:hypothetical protein HYY74_01215 [Candidatus Woesearchaeota archaeon]|nr:hypothetical protein [Candidatus Woesearchaeota archaeon]
MIVFLDVRDKTVVLKFGTNSLVRGNYPNINRDTVYRIAHEVSGLARAGVHACIVTSGAVAAGMELLGYRRRPEGFGERRVFAALGGRLLWNLYAAAFEEHGLEVAYCPVSGNYNFYDGLGGIMGLSRSEGFILLLNTYDAMLEYVRDNDTLAAEVACDAQADALVVFTDSGTMGTGNGESKQQAMEKMALHNKVQARLGLRQTSVQVLGIESLEEACKSLYRIR